MSGTGSLVSVEGVGKRYRNGVWGVRDVTFRLPAGRVTGLVGHGYWLVASDGGIFAFDAPFHGSMGGQKLNKPISGMVRYGDGYLMVGSDGGIFNFSSAAFVGSLGDKPPAAPVVAVAALP
jgi:ribosomal protein L24E